MFLVAILDGYLRFVVCHELRAAMEERDVELGLQRTLEKFVRRRPRIISDHGSQFIAKDFGRSIRYSSLTRAFTSVGCPQSNGKVERLFRTIKADCVPRRSFLSIEDARTQIDEYIWYYNYRRLHSTIGYVSPFDKLIGRDKEIIKMRDEKLAKARELRVKYNADSTLFQDPIYSDSR